MIQKKNGLHDSLESNCSALTGVSATHAPLNQVGEDMEIESLEDEQEESLPTPQNNQQMSE